jgi:hypothetical protein
LDTITIKIYLIFEHMKEQLDEYGYIGLFAEDGLESVHQVVNQIDDMLQGVEGDLKVKSVFRRITLLSKRYAIQNANKCGRDDDVVPKSPPKKKRRQGKQKDGAPEKPLPQDDVAALIAVATDSLRRCSSL